MSQIDRAAALTPPLTDTALTDTEALRMAPTNHVYYSNRRSAPTRVTSERP